MTQNYDCIRLEVTDGIATLTYNRPDKLNAFTAEMTHEVIDAFDRIDADDNVRAVIVTGAGRAFSAGADLSGGADTFASFSLRGDDSPVRADGSFDYSKASARDIGGLLTLRIFRCLKPVIAAINGVAAGMGVTATLAMDFRLAVPGVKFALPFTRRGIVPESASAYFLPRLVGLPKSLEWCYSGAPFLSEEAHAAGLVQALHAPEELLSAARAFAHRITEGSSPVSIALTRQMIWRGLDMQHPMEAHRIDSRGVVSRARSADAKEGVQAFLEKRTAHYPDRVSKDMPDFFPWWEEPEYR